MALLQLPETEFDAQKMLDRLFADMPLLSEFPFPRVSYAMPPCDIFEKDGKYFVEFAAPGCDAKDVSVEVTGATVTINGTCGQFTEKKNAKYYRRQIFQGTFTRTVTLPQDIDPQHVEANMHNGLLTLTLTPVKPIVPKKIAIKAS